MGAHAGNLVRSFYDRYLAWHSHDLSFAYNRTDTHADGLLLGCAMFLLLFHARATALRAYLRRPEAAVAAAAVLALAVDRLRFDAAATYAGGIALVNIAAAALIAHVILAPARAPARLLSLRPVVWIGARSYGIYLYHFPIFFCVAPQTVHLDKYSFVAVVTPITLLAAAISFRFVERPFLGRTQYPRIAEQTGALSEPARGSPAPSSPAPTH